MPFKSVTTDLSISIECYIIDFFITIFFVYVVLQQTNVVKNFTTWFERKKMEQLKPSVSF